MAPTPYRGKGSRYKSPIVYENGKYLEDMEGKYGEDVFADYIIDFMERNRDDPFFVYFPMALTHRPLKPTPNSPEFDFYASAQPDARPWHVGRT